LGKELAAMRKLGAENQVIAQEGIRQLLTPWFTNSL